MPASGFHQAWIVANGSLRSARRAWERVAPGEYLIAADGGAMHCLAAGRIPDIVIGDFDSLSTEALQLFEAAGSQIERHPVEKNQTDLELAVHAARRKGATSIGILAGVGTRWDMNLGNLLLIANPQFQDCEVFLLDGGQEVYALHPGKTWSVPADPGDTVSLIPLMGDCHGIHTSGLRYPLKGETLHFGATRGISNVMQEDEASVSLESGYLLAVVIHGDVDEIDWS